MPRTAKANACRSATNRAVASGKLVKPDACEACGAKNVPLEKAHHDYDKPLEIRWLCVSCHRKWDREQPKGGTPATEPLKPVQGIRDRVKELRRVKASELRPNPRNWRTHPRTQQDALRGILAEVGYADALLARELPDGGLELVDGHLRRDTTPEQIVPVLVLDVTESEAAKLLVALDPLAAMAEADPASLDALMREVETGSEALAKMLDDLAKDAGCDWAQEQNAVTEDDAPEPPVEPVTRSGDLWILGDHRLLCGDSTKPEDVARLLDGAKPEMMFTDPPYGVDYEGGHFHSGDVKIKREREKLAADDSTDIYAKFLPLAMQHVDGPCYLWFADSKALPVYQAVHDCGGVISALLIWHKTNATYAAMNAQYKQRHEPCLYFKPKGSTLRWVGPSDACTLWEFKRDGRNDLHPTQKPVALAANALKNHKAASVVDFFCGSGSTIIAGEQLGRRVFAMEVDPAYTDVCLIRYINLTGRQPTLDGRTFEEWKAERSAG